MMKHKELLTTEELVRLCVKRNQQAYKQFYDSYAAQLLGVCLRYVGNREDAQEVLQDGMLKIFDKLHTLKDVNALEGWMRKIMVNLSLNYIQRRHLDWSGYDEVEEVLIDNWDRYEIDYLMLTISQLPDKYRIVFNMHEVEGYEFDEISKQLNIEESSVRSILCRSRKMLKEKLKNYDK